MFELRKIGFVRRASAWLLDAILIAVLSTGFMALIALICKYDQHIELADSYYAQVEDFREGKGWDLGGVAAFYGFTCTVKEVEDEEGKKHEEYEITKDGQSATTNDVVIALFNSEGKDPETEEAYKLYITLASTAANEYQLVYSLTFMTISVGLLLSFFALEFVLPLLLKNGQTVGKKVFSICLVRNDCVKVPAVALFARAILGKFAVETMFPILLVFLALFGGLGWIALALIGALFLLNAVLFFATANKTPIHDIFGRTVAVDMKLQMIFESEDELVAKKASHKEFIETKRN